MYSHRDDTLWWMAVSLVPRLGGFCTVFGLTLEEALSRELANVIFFHTGVTWATTHDLATCFACAWPCQIRLARHPFTLIPDDFPDERGSKIHVASCTGFVGNLAATPPAAPQSSVGRPRNGKWESRGKLGPHRLRLPPSL